MLLTEEQELMIGAAREFATTRLQPEVEKIEAGHFPHELFREMLDLGFRNMTLPEAAGGLGESMTAHLLVLEEIAKVNFVVALVGTQNMVGEMLVKYGTEEQKSRLIPKYTSGGHMAGFAFTEPAAGSDAAGIKTTAVRDGEDWIINGQKTMISYIDACDAFIVTARTNETDGGGISAFFVEKDLPGFRVGSMFTKLGMRGSDTGELFFDDVRVSGNNMIGKENKGLHVALKLLDDARLGTSAAALGTARGAMNKAVAFIKQREQFGQKLMKFQGLQWYVAEMEAQLKAARALLYETAQSYDAGFVNPADIAATKLICTETALRVTEKAIQLCGGYGVITETDVDRHFRDAKVSQIIEGTSEILKIIIARDALK